MAFRSDTTYNHLSGGWKVADHKNQHISLFKKPPSKRSFHLKNGHKKCFQPRKVNSNWNFSKLLHYSAANLLIPRGLKSKACSKFLRRVSEEKAGKIWYFIQIHDIQIASDRSCQYDFSVTKTLQRKILEKTFFTHDVIYKKHRKLLGNLLVNT